MRLMPGISIVLLAAGCVSAEVQRLDQVPRPERSPDLIEVLFEKPDRPYTVIAVVESKTGTVFKGFDDLRRRLIAEAAKLGGDAVILGAEGSDATMLITAVSQIHSEEKKLTGEVIVFKHPNRGAP
ncbi:hypothetical protein ACFL3S_09435 [Gemmatimonadota bacterium]